MIMTNQLNSVWLDSTWFKSEANHQNGIIDRMELFLFDRKLSFNIEYISQFKCNHLK